MRKEKAEYYLCEYCLTSVLLHNKQRHLKSAYHKYNKKNTVVIIAKNYTSDESSRMMQAANNKGKAWHLIIENNKYANIDNVKIIEK